MAEDQDPLEVPTPKDSQGINERDDTMATPSNAFGPVENADETRQAQHMTANDAPVDVNNNAALARSQALTTDVLGKSFAANSDRRDKLADYGMGKTVST